MSGSQQKDSACMPDERARLAELVQGYELAKLPVGPFSQAATSYYHLDVALAQGLNETVDLLDRRSSDEEWFVPAGFFDALLDSYKGQDLEVDAHCLARQLEIDRGGVTLYRYKPDRHFSSGSWNGMSFHMLDYYISEKKEGVRALRSDLQNMLEDPATEPALMTEIRVRLWKEENRKK